MNERMQWTIVWATISVFVMTAAFLPVSVRAGDLEPSAPPGSTMHTLDEIYEKVSLQGYPHAPVAKTGQTMSHAPGDDGELEKGVAWPDPRFADREDGTVIDNLTGLMWTKDANMYGQRNWTNALSDCASCTVGGYIDWRLPNERELLTLIDFGRHLPALPSGHLFSNVQSYYYWSSTTSARDTSDAWRVDVYNSLVGVNHKYYDYNVWCVRGGQ